MTNDTKTLAQTLRDLADEALTNSDPRGLGLLVASARLEALEAEVKRLRKQVQSQGMPMAAPDGETCGVCGVPLGPEDATVLDAEAGTCCAEHYDLEDMEQAPASAG